MIRSLVKQGIKRVLRMETRPAEYGGPMPYVAPPEPPMPPAPVAAEPPQPEPETATVAAAPEPEPAKKPKKPRAKKAKVEQVVAAPPPVDEVVAAPPPVDDVAGPALDTGAVQVILDEMVRPALQGDGGDITLLRIENNDIYVKLVGSCSTCPSSILTMKAGVEALLKEEFPSMNQLIQVD
jgi:Fe-S cluster biogenesis protein NfuA